MKICKVIPGATTLVLLSLDQSFAGAQKQTGELTGAPYDQVHNGLAKSAARVVGRWSVVGF